MNKGIVYRSTGSWYLVKDASGVFYSCRIKGKFRIQGIKSTNPIAVGDRVEFDVVEEGSELLGIITAIEPRDNYIVRKSVNLSKQTHIIASNIDQAFLLITLNNPPTSFAFIDRFLITAEAYHIPAVLLFNKMDTYSEEEKAEIGWMQNVYESIGYTCYKISSFNEPDVKLIAGLMEDKSSMFTGHSGVGKSTLLNSISPDLNLKTKVISEQHQQGQHTTTYAEMFDLEGNARIVDTPGIKGFGVVDMEPEELGNYFPEFLKVKNNCKFNNCLHTDEPKCAVKDGVEEESIPASRYKSYIQLLEDDNAYRS
ncbi:MAG: ribosome small subunit-dependent GTPase A [Flavobacteriaceae bacterium]|nr:ribosome small subunit-dependent GTPase A [Flavobacteriaceae bacterium]